MDGIKSNDSTEKVNIIKIRTIKTKNEITVRFWFQPGRIPRDVRNTTTCEANKVENGKDYK